VVGDQDGPLFRAASRHADAVDNAATPAERRGAWARLLPSAAAALVEGLVRQSMVTGAVLFSIVVAIMGATSGEAAWVVVGLGAGIGAVALVCVAVARWSFARQWAVLVGVVVAQAGLMATYWGSGT
jgi:hypothetical protein